MSKQTSRKKSGNKRTNIIPTSYDQTKPIWIFTDLDKSGEFAFDMCKIGNDSYEILDKIINYSSMTWGEIKRQTHDDNRSKHHYLTYSSLSDAAQRRLKVKHLEDRSDDIFSFAFTNMLRIIGYTEKEKFYVLWYDPHHEVCPSAKKKN